MRLLPACLLLLAAPAGADVRYTSFHSPSLGREVSYAVDLPASYDESDEAYPVLYALHGLFEAPSFWEERGLAALLRDASARGEAPEMIVVAVDGESSFFVNTPEAAYQDLVTRDLVSHVEATYRVIARREARCLLGVSMGGYAALRIAFATPRVFGAVAAHSAMLLTRIPTAEAGAGRWHMRAFQGAFGTPIDPERWSAADPLTWAARAIPDGVPALYFDCGSQDRFGLHEGNAELHRLLEARGVPHEFALLPGDHGYAYVRSVFPRSLRFLARALSGGSASSP
jgi:S-formylglutathione hydrolase FrmB